MTLVLGFFFAAGILIGGGLASCANPDPAPVKTICS